MREGGPIIYLQDCQHHMAAKTHPYVGARGPTKGKFGQTMSPAVAALVIKLIVLPSHAALNIQAGMVADGTARKKVSL